MAWHCKATVYDEKLAHHIRMMRENYLQASTVTYKLHDTVGSVRPRRDTQRLAVQYSLSYISLSADMSADKAVQYSLSCISLSGCH
jgi:hypothetical protein